MATFIQTLDKSSRLDDPRCWAEADVIPRPAFDVLQFQKRIDGVCGKTRDGHSIIRLRWAWDEDCWSEFFTRWDAAGQPVKSEMRAKYRYTTVEIDSETRIDIPPPRWVLEERIEPAQYLAAWEANRWQFDAQLQKEVVYRPQAPRDGYYTLLYYIAGHDPDFKCCERALRADQECFGVYRAPSEWDLTRLAKLKRSIESGGQQQNPYEPLSAETFAAIAAESEAAERDRFEDKRRRCEENRRVAAQIIKPLAAYSLPGERRTAAGIIIPGIKN